jgi:hypothetical protein
MTDARRGKSIDTETILVLSWPGRKMGLGRDRFIGTGFLLGGDKVSRMRS